MKFQVGDKVLLIHSNEEGEVIDVINKQMVTVDVGGVQFPAKAFTEREMNPEAIVARETVR